MVTPNQTMNHPARVQRRTATPTGSRGSLTQTVADPESSEHTSPSDPLVLRLRGAHDSATTTTTLGAEDFSQTNDPPRHRRRHIQWDENVVDNEGLGRKKSKVCCIYHKPRAVGESSDESSSDSSDDDSDADSGSSGDGARPVKGLLNGPGNARRKNNRRDRDHAHARRNSTDGDEDGNADGDGDGDRDGSGHGHGHDHGSDCGRDHRKRHGTPRRPSPNAYERMPKYHVKPCRRSG